MGACLTVPAVAHRPGSLVALGSASLDELMDMDPYAIPAPFRAAVADRCQRMAKAQFAEAKQTRDAGRIEFADEVHEWGRRWMRERRRWVPTKQADETDPGTGTP